MKRVAVVGCPGSGKSTFCRRLANKVKLPIIHLDTYYHDKSKAYFEAQDLEAWKVICTQLASEDKWIIDGNFGATFEERFARADTIVFFDYPRYLCIWRIFKRRIKFHNRPRPEMPDDWQERFDYGFMRYVWNFKKQSRHKIIDALHVTNADFIVLKHPRDAEKYLKSL